MKMKTNLEGLCIRGLASSFKKSITTAALAAMMASGPQVSAQQAAMMASGPQVSAQQYNLAERTDCVSENVEVVSLDDKQGYSVAKTYCPSKGKPVGQFSDRLRESLGLEQDESKVIEAYYLDDSGKPALSPIGVYCTLNDSHMTDLTHLGRDHPSGVPLGVRVRESTEEDGCAVESEVHYAIENDFNEKFEDLTGRIRKLEEIGSSRPQSEKSSEAPVEPPEVQAVPAEPVEPPTEVVQIPHFVVPLRGNSTKNLPVVVYEDNLVKSVIGLDPRNGYSPEYGNASYDSFQLSNEEIAKELLRQANLEKLIHSVSSKIGAMAVKEHYGGAPELGRDIILHETLGDLGLSKKELLNGGFNYGADSAAADLVVERAKEGGIYTMQDLAGLTDKNLLSKFLDLGYKFITVKRIVPGSSFNHVRTKGTRRALNKEIKRAKKDVFKTCGSLGSQNGRIACAFDRGYRVIGEIVGNRGNRK